MRSLILLALLVCSSAFGKEFTLLDPQEIYINYHNYIASVRDPMLYPEKAKESLNLIINSDIFRYGFWNTQILAKTTSSQYRYIALDMIFGLRLSEGIELFYHHLSQHLLDGTQPYLQGFPVEDSVGINLFIFRADDKKKEGIF